MSFSGADLEVIRVAMGTAKHYLEVMRERRERVRAQVVRRDGRLRSKGDPFAWDRYWADHAIFRAREAEDLYETLRSVEMNIGEELDMEYLRRLEAEPAPVPCDADVGRVDHDLEEAQDGRVVCLVCGKVWVPSVQMEIEF